MSKKHVVLMCPKCKNSIPTEMTEQQLKTVISYNATCGKCGAWIGVDYDKSEIREERQDK